MEFEKLFKFSATVAGSCCCCGCLWGCRHSIAGPHTTHARLGLCCATTEHGHAAVGLMWLGQPPCLDGDGQLSIAFMWQWSAFYVAMVSSSRICSTMRMAHSRVPSSPTLSLVTTYRGMCFSTCGERGVQ